MRFDRWGLPGIRLMSVLAFVLVATVSAQGDDTWHNVYHSLKRFFTGKPSATPVVHHRVRHSVNHEKNSPTPEPAPSLAEGSPSPDVSATPRVVILPAASPAAEEPQPRQQTPAPVTTVRAPEGVSKPQPSPEFGPVLRSLSGPSPADNPSRLAIPHSESREHRN